MLSTFCKSSRLGGTNFWYFLKLFYLFKYLQTSQYNFESYLEHSIKKGHKVLQKIKNLKRTTKNFSLVYNI